MKFEVTFFDVTTVLLIDLLSAGKEAAPENIKCRDLPASVSFLGSLPPPPFLLFLDH